MILAEKVILLRKKNGWSQEELAERLGISRQSVSKWESGASIPDLDKILKMSELFGVSTDFLLKDALEEASFPEDDVPPAESARSVSLEDANTFLDLTARLARRFALAVAVLIVSPICLILLGGFAEYGIGAVTEGMAAGIGVAVLLLMVASAVGALIHGCMQLSKYEYLEKQRLALEYGVSGIVRKRREDYEHTHRTSIVSGVVLCILAVIPLLLAGAMGADDFTCVCLVDVLLALVACGVYLFVRSGCMYGGFQKLLQEGDYTPENKEAERKIGFFPGAYWCVATAVYLAISFSTNRWDTSWIVWPVAGVLFAAVYGILNAVIRARKG